MQAQAAPGEHEATAASAPAAAAAGAVSAAPPLSAAVGVLRIGLPRSAADLPASVATAAPADQAALQSARLVVKAAPGEGGSSAAGALPHHVGVGPRGAVGLPLQPEAGGESPRSSMRNSAADARPATQHPPPPAAAPPSDGSTDETVPIQVVRLLGSLVHVLHKRVLHADAFHEAAACSLACMTN